MIEHGVFVMFCISSGLSRRAMTLDISQLSLSNGRAKTGKQGSLLAQGSQSPSGEVSMLLSGAR